MIGVLGAGPHGRQIAAYFGDAILYDDNPDLHLLPCRKGVYDRPFVIGAIWPQVRRQIEASLPPDAKLWERGQVVFPGVQIGYGATVGNHTHILYNAVVSHGCTVGAFVTICSGAVLCGEVTVEDDVFIGANATIIHGGITVGQGAVIGAGSVVIEDVPAGATVVGNPARVLVAS